MNKLVENAGVLAVFILCIQWLLYVYFGFFPSICFSVIYFSVFCFVTNKYDEGCGAFYVWRHDMPVVINFIIILFVSFLRYLNSGFLWK